MKKMVIQKCNGCGKIFRTENQMLMEGVFCADWEWGYFSEKDGERHCFCLCEACYDSMIEKFVIPVTVEE